ncbi:MAG: formate dehydrogenase accessory sulfurtransferase FdhD [Pseudomonadales bacterium]|jgi:FdhD protein|nr:formate dehydrogenase accessory sulfurtransferase FdhD [Pseudomonadales bacterium]
MSQNASGRAIYSIRQLREGVWRQRDDSLAVEEPLEIRLGYTDPRQGRVHRSVSITMRTPGRDVDLALGFLYSESILKRLADVEQVEQNRPNVIRLELSERASFDPARLERHFYTTSSCGVCGKASLETLSLSGFDALPPLHQRFTLSSLCALPAQLRTRQPLFSATGGCHGVALFDLRGNIELVAEDVGRHNAMDKLIGALLQQNRLPLREHGILLSGRASFELLQKALSAGCPLVAAVGAPSSLAVELAQEFNIILLGFLGEGRCNVYHGHEALDFDG